MHNDLAQVQAHAMLKTPQAEQTSTPYCVEHSRAMGDRCVGMTKNLKLKRLCR